MRRLIYATLVLMVGVVSYSCTPVKYTIQGSYQPATSFVTSKSFDYVWNNVIDFFAENNLPIEILEKDSGLIVSNNIKVGDNLVTWEDENGKLVNPDSWFVLPYYNVSGRTVVGGTATCSFNVRVRELEDGNIKIQINLHNVVGYYIIEWFNSFSLKKEVVETTIPQECKSTGKFEADLLALFNE